MSAEKPYLSAFTVLTQEIKRRGYGGLYNATAGCACEADDLAPCGGGIAPHCDLGHKHAMTTDPDMWVMTASKAPMTDAEIEGLIE